MTYWYLLSDQVKSYIAIPFAIMLTILLGYVDFATGYELSFFIFYVFPVAFGAWFVGRSFGLFMSIFAISVWFYADRMSGHTYSEQWIVYWNAGVRLMFFCIDTFLLSALKKRMDFEKEWARIDGLTGALNGRGFRDKLEIMFPFAARTKASFAMAFIDLDNFKKINDTKGHAMGDLILQRSVAVMKKNLRDTDFIGRMGGDEFAIFLPATDEKGAEKVLKNMRQKLLDQVAAEEWGIGYSIGVVTLDPKLNEVPSHAEVILQADHLMYDIKKSGKNNLTVKQYKQK